MQRFIYKEFSSDRKFGLELEMSTSVSKKDIGNFLLEYELLYGSDKKVVVTNGNHGWAHTCKNDYWHVKYDSTCGDLGKGLDFGWEVASFIGQGKKDIDHIARAARYLHNCGGKTNKNCGFHIHAETKDFDKNTMGILYARWIKIEAALLSICDSFRRDNLYCRTIQSRVIYKKIDYNPEKMVDFWHQIMPCDLSRHNNYEKRYTINSIGFAISTINPNYDRNTLELRLPECELNESHVRNWTKLFLNFVDSCQDLTVPENLLGSLDLNEILFYLGFGPNPKDVCSNGESNTFCILDSELMNLQIWFLNKLINSDNLYLALQARKKLDHITNL